MSRPDNPYFARSYVNRLWGYLLGTGLIEPLDDIRAGNPPTNPELLDFLTAQFIDTGFDMRHVLRLICTSRTYQLSIQTNRWNAILGKMILEGEGKGLSEEFVLRMFKAIHQESINHQEKIINS